MGVNIRQSLCETLAGLPSECRPQPNECGIECMNECWHSMNKTLVGLRSGHASASHHVFQVLNDTATARFLPWLEPFSRRMSLKSFKLSSSRSASRTDGGLPSHLTDSVCKVVLPKSVPTKQISTDPLLSVAKGNPRANSSTSALS